MLSGAMAGTEGVARCDTVQAAPLPCFSFVPTSIHRAPQASSASEPDFLSSPRWRNPVYVCELTKRKYRGKKPKVIHGPDDVVAFVGSKLRKEQREHFLVLLLNARHEVMAKETVSVGSLNASIVHPREVFKPAVVASAATVVLVHNHPSGDPEPSEEDLAITKRLVQVGELLGVSVLDHVIVASRGVVSLRSRQLL